METGFPWSRDEGETKEGNILFKINHQRSHLT